MKQTKTKQLKHLLSKINVAQQYHADKLIENLQTQTDDMIADSLTKPKSAYNYIIVEAALLGVYKKPKNQAQQGVGNYLCDIVRHSCYRHIRYNRVLFPMVLQT